MRKKSATIVEIAHISGVSNATVSRVLNNMDIVKPETCEKVYNAMRELGINVDERIKESNKPGKLILFNLPFGLNPFFNEIFQGAKASAHQHGYNILINQDHMNLNTYPKMEQLIRDLKPSGIIFLNHIDKALTDKLLSVIPFVRCCDYDINHKRISSVGVDDFKAAMMVMDYLFSLNVQKIAFISSPLNYTDVKQRKNGYLNALQMHNIRPVDSWIVQLPEISYDMAYSVATQILSNPNRPEAIFAATDILAAAVVNAALDLCIDVPSQLIVVGYDNTEYSRISNPSITTVNVSKFQIGFSACELLIDTIDNPDSSAQHISLPTELVIRKSSML